MHFLSRFLSVSLRHQLASNYHNHQILTRTLYDAVASIKCTRDRGLDHAVARERHLKPILNLRDLITSEPSKSLPLSLITQSKETLLIPFRPVEFIRKYPSIFQEFHPGSLSINPHVKLTPETVSLSSEENLLYQSVNYKLEIAGRLLKLLMVSRINKMPIFLLERLKWELGLPQDYEKILIPEFPDYFRVVNGSHLGKIEKILELVCWSDEFAVSEMEKKGNKDGKLQFCLQYSNDFEMDKRHKKWVDEWQKLPYISPYENAMHLAAKTDESDKWVVAVLHEVLSLFIGKKAEKESLLCLGEFLGLRSQFKRAFLQHPGIFYISNKIGIPTVVLREAYKRGMLIERNPLMVMRYKYTQLMNTVKDENKSRSIQQKIVTDTRTGEGEELEDNDSGEEEDAEMYDLSDDINQNDSEEDEAGENATKRGRFKMKAEYFEEKSPKRSVARSPNGRHMNHNVYETSTRFCRRTFCGDQATGTSPQKLGDGETKRGRFKTMAGYFEEKSPKRSVARSPNGQHMNHYVYETSTRFSRRTTFQRNQATGRFPQKLGDGENSMKRGSATRKPVNFEEKNPEIRVARSPDRQSAYDGVHRSSSSFSRGTKRAARKLDVSGNKVRSKTEKTPTQ